MEEFLACGDRANLIPYIQRLGRQNAIDCRDRPVREFDRFLRNEHQVSIQRLALVFESCSKCRARVASRVVSDSETALRSLESLAPFPSCASAREHNPTTDSNPAACECSIPRPS